MCGIAGVICKKFSGQELAGHSRKMASALTHRGPDDGGEWSDPSVGISLSHRRLSIIDQSSYGHQPMVSPSGRYIISYNGEIYNFNELRQELDASATTDHPEWKGHSDTEVILAAIDTWGLENALPRFIGMFAFALWDRRDRRLHLVRDRLGIKPLYYGWQGNSFLFGSELKALFPHPDFEKQIDREALALLMRFSYIPSPHSIYKGILKLLPGTVVTIDPNDLKALPEPVPYWSAKQAAEDGISSPFTGSEMEAIETLDTLLKKAVKLRMISDVPLGAFLSGGIDSSTVVALMQNQSPQAIKTFSIGFNNQEHNEADYAKAVAKHLGTDHTELYVTPEQAMAVIPGLPNLFDEPFADASQIPTFLVSELARRKVTVSLSGDGGDEVFGGYKIYTMAPKLWKSLGWMPLWSQHLLLNAVSTASGKFFKAGESEKNNIVRNKLKKLSEIFPFKSPEELYFRLRCLPDGASSVLSEHDNVANPYANEIYKTRSLNSVERMMYLDSISFLSDDILAKVDRASMGVSLEARVPLLDHRVVEFAWRLPLKMKIRDGVGKWLLRQVLYKYVPKNLVERPKMGFDVPLSQWLRGPLRPWAEELLNEQRIKKEGFFKPDVIRQKWTEHLSGKYDHKYYLWNALMFQAWLENQS